MECTHAPVCVCACVCVCVCVCVSDCTYAIMYFMMVSKIVSTSNSLVTPDSLSPSLPTSAHIMTPDPWALIFQHPGPKLKRLQKEGPIMALNQHL